MNIRTIARMGTAILAAGVIGTFAVGMAQADSTAVDPNAGVVAGSGHLVVIDATTDKDAAVNLLTHYKDAPDHTFIPNGQPTFGTSDWQPATFADGKTGIPGVAGSATDKISLELSVKHTESSSVKIGGSVETSFGYDLAGVVDTELSFKFSGGHTWDSSTSDTAQIWATAMPNKAVWIEASTSTATFTGDFRFSYGGNEYLVKNVTITQPAAPTVGGQAVTNYRVMEADMNAVNVPTNLRGGLFNVNDAPQLKSYIAGGH
jgi:hypothetical protein